jgi:iron complex outermembrane recepter protein
MTRSYLRATSALGCGVMMVAGHATAQTAPVDPASTDSATVSPEQTAAAEREAAPQAADGDIIVTAQRREESLSRVGATVSVVGAEALISQGVKSAADLTRFVPGFQATQSYNGNPVYTLRGVGFNSPNANNTPPVGLYLDEAAIAYPYMTLGLVHDLERVEVLKGPQGTLYGRNATGGLVNFVAAKPTSDPHMGLILEVGNYQTVRTAIKAISRASRATNATARSTRIRCAPRSISSIRDRFR